MPRFETAESFAEYMKNLPVAEKREHFRNHYAAYALTEPSKAKTKNKNLLDQLVEVLGLDADTVTAWSKEAQELIDAIEVFVDSFVKKAA